MTVKETADRATAYASDKLHAAGEKLQDAGTHVRDAANAARDSAGESFDAAREKVAGVYGSASDRTVAAAGAARDRAGAAYATAYDSASKARGRAKDGVTENPLAAVIGGVAVGILIGALLPRSQRETEALAPIGDKLASLATGALSAAKEAGQEKLDELGINKAGAREQVDKFIDTAQQAAASAGSAAAGSIRQSQS